MWSKIFIVSAIILCASAQFTLPPDVPFANAQQATTTGTENGVTFKATGSFAYLAATASAGNYLFHADMTFVQGKTGHDLTWESYGPNAAGFLVFNTSSIQDTNPCTTAQIGGGGSKGTISCGTWASSKAGAQTKWTQTCSMVLPFGTITFDTTAFTSNGQLLNIASIVSMSGTQLTSTFTAIDAQTSTPPSPSEFVAPASCPPPPMGLKKIKSLRALLKHF